MPSDLDPVEPHVRKGERLDLNADLVIRGCRSQPRDYCVTPTPPVGVTHSKVNLSWLDGPGDDQIVHLDVIGVPDQTIDELRHAGLLSA